MWWWFTWLYYFLHDIFAKYNSLMQVAAEVSLQIHKAYKNIMGWLGSLPGNTFAD